MGGALLRRRRSPGGGRVQSLDHLERGGTQDSHGSATAAGVRAAQHECSVSMEILHTHTRCLPSALSLYWVFALSGLAPPDKSVIPLGGAAESPPSTSPSPAAPPTSPPTLLSSVLSLLVFTSPVAQVLLVGGGRWAGLRLQVGANSQL